VPDTLSPSPYPYIFPFPYSVIQLSVSLTALPPPGSPSPFPLDRLFPPRPCRHNSSRSDVSSLCLPPALYKPLHFLIAPVTVCLPALLSPHSSTRSPFFTSIHPSFTPPSTFLHHHLPCSGLPHARTRRPPPPSILAVGNTILLSSPAPPRRALQPPRMHLHPHPPFIRSPHPRPLHLRLSLCPLSLSLLAFVIVFFGISHLLAVGYEG
jgi:hypothetical protein